MIINPLHSSFGGVLVVKKEFEKSYFVVMEEIINDIKQNIADKIRWSYPIALKLQQYDYRLAVHNYLRKFYRVMHVFD